MKLTDEQIDAEWRVHASKEGFTTAQFVRNFARAIEAALASQGDALTEKQDDTSAERVYPAAHFDTDKLLGIAAECGGTTLRKANLGVIQFYTHELHKFAEKIQDHPATVNTALLERIKELEQALDVALKALETYFNQYPHMQKGYTLDAIEILKEVRHEAT